MARAERTSLRPAGRGLRGLSFLAAFIALALTACAGLNSAPGNPVNIRGVIEAGVYRAPDGAFACGLPELDPVRHRIYDEIGHHTGRVVFLDEGKFVRVDYHELKPGHTSLLRESPERFYRRYFAQVLWPMIKRAAPDAQPARRKFVRVRGREAEFVVVRLPAVANRLDRAGLPYDAFRAMYVYAKEGLIFVVSMIDFDRPWATWGMDPEAVDIPNELRDVFLGCQFGRAAQS